MSSGGLTNLAAMSAFYVRGSASDWHPGTTKRMYQEILSRGGYFPIHPQGSQRLGAGRSCHSISSLLPVNSKKYIPTV